MMDALTGESLPWYVSLSYFVLSYLQLTILTAIGPRLVQSLFRYIFPLSVSRSAQLIALVDGLGLLGLRTRRFVASFAVASHDRTLANDVASSTAYLPWMPPVFLSPDVIISAKLGNLIDLYHVSGNIIPYATLPVFCSFMAMVHPHFLRTAFFSPSHPFFFGHYDSLLQSFSYRKVKAFHTSRLWLSSRGCGSVRSGGNI
jgi:hypothetical protein